MIELRVGAEVIGKVGGFGGGITVVGGDVVGVGFVGEGCVSWRSVGG